MRKVLLQWDRLMICREFGKDSRTVGKLLVAAGLDAKNKLTTREVFDALHGDLNAERIKLTREQRVKLERENSVASGELADVRQLAVIVNKAIGSVKAAIMAAANLEREDKEAILKKCAGIWAGHFAVRAADRDGMEPTTQLHG